MNYSWHSLAWAEAGKLLKFVYLLTIVSDSSYHSTCIRPRTCPVISSLSLCHCCHRHSLLFLSVWFILYQKLFLLLLCLYPCFFLLDVCILLLISQVVCVYLYYFFKFCQESYPYPCVMHVVTNSATLSGIMLRYCLVSWLCSLFYWVFIHDYATPHYLTV